jgi:hypothetical protein
MRLFIIKSSLITGFIILLLVTGGLFLSVQAPLHPGNLFFQVQYFAEQETQFLYPDIGDKANYLLDVTERRIYDLNLRTGTKFELIALEYLDKALDQAAIAISLIPEEKTNDLRMRFLSLVKQSGELIKLLRVVPLEEPSIYSAFQAKIQAYIQLAEATDVLNIELSKVSLTPLVNHANNAIPTPVAIRASGLIPFPPDTKGANHAFYPLAGQHGLLICESCHDAGTYVGTPNSCVLCHILEQPSYHFTRKCELCHTPVSWMDIVFDHLSENAADCSECHENNKPADHYSGQCSACHVTQTWTDVTFNHAVAGAVDCESCHSRVEPENHYQGQCSNCHNTSNWTSVVFNHSGFEDCISCHSDFAPANHYTGQCAQCHSTTTWKGATFDHTGLVDCVSCHSSTAPANHYAGRCSECHTTSTWRGASFDHSGLSDCISCHAERAPANHYSGQCSNCHNTSSWAGANFDHNGLTDCITCHAERAPANHYSGQCSNCHNTSGWAGASFDHSGLTDCISCHSGNTRQSLFRAMLELP